MNVYRQGDVFIIATNEQPGSKQVKPEQGRIILAHGEATGHTHAIDATQVEAYVREVEGEMFLRVLTEAGVTHQEHDTITLPPGDYVVRRQREYVPEGERFVAD